MSSLLKKICNVKMKVDGCAPFVEKLVGFYCRVQILEFMNTPYVLHPVINKRLQCDMPQQIYQTTNPDVKIIAAYLSPAACCISFILKYARNRDMWT